MTLKASDLAEATESLPSLSFLDIISKVLPFIVHMDSRFINVLEGSL